MTSKPKRPTIVKGPSERRSQRKTDPPRDPENPPPNDHVNRPNDKPTELNDEPQSVIVVRSKEDRLKQQRESVSQQREQDVGGSPKPNGSIERRSKNKTTRPPQLEHESGPLIEETAQLSNGQTRHVADNEHLPPDQAGPEASPEGKQNPEFVRNGPSFVRSQAKIPAEFNDGTPEPRTAFEAKSHQFMETLYLQGMSIGEIAKLWKMSKSGVWARVGHLTPKPSVQEIPPPSSVAMLSEPSAPPPEIIPYDVTNSTPPRIVDEKNGRGEEETHLSVVQNNGGLSRPVSIVIRPDDPALQDIIVELLHLSASRGLPFNKYLSSGMAVEDLRDAAFCKTLIVGDGQDFRTNLLATAKKANLHDRYRTDAGLDVTGVERQ